MKPTLKTLTFAAAMVAGAFTFSGTASAYDDGVQLGRKLTNVQKQYLIDQLIIARKPIGGYKLGKKYRRALAVERAHKRRALRRARSNRYVTMNNGKRVHVADIALVNTALVRKPGGKWKKVAVRAKVGKVYAKRRKPSYRIY